MILNVVLFPNLTRICFVLALLAAVSIVNADDDSTHTGEATFTNYGGGGNCSLPTPNYTLTAGMNATDYANSEACGGVILVTNEDTGLSVTVRVDDHCPGCAPGGINLDQEAFAQIADISAGRIPISWHYVANNQAGNIKLSFKEGSTQWWTGVQVRDHLYPIAKLEYRITGSGNDYTTVSRSPYNYFIAPGGFGIGPYDFRFSDIRGQTVEAGGISLALGSEIDTGTQFPVSDGGDTLESSDNDNTQHPAIAVMETILSWSGSYCSKITVTNPNSTPLTWKINFDNIEGTIDSLWNAIWSQTGSLLIASGVPYNATLKAGESTEFGFCANK